MKTHVFDLGLITISKWREWFPEKKRCVRLGSRTPDSPILVFHSTTNPTSHWLQRDPSEESGSLQRESESNCCNSDLHIVVVSLWSSMIPLSLSFFLGFMTNLGLFFSLQNIWSKIWWNSSFSLFSRFEDLKAWIQPVFSLPLIKKQSFKIGGINILRRFVQNGVFILCDNAERERFWLPISPKDSTHDLPIVVAHSSFSFFSFFKYIYIIFFLISNFQYLFFNFILFFNSNTRFALYFLDSIFESNLCYKSR